MKRSILVVDDDEAIREFLQIVLEDEGYQALLASHGAEGLALLDESSPGLILLDMHMPGMDGRQFMQAYRERPNAGAPVVVLAAVREAAQYAAEIGAQDHLAKPFELEDLLSVVRRYIGGTGSSPP